MDTTNAVDLRLKCLELAVQSSGHADEGIVLIKARKFMDFLTTGAGPKLVDNPRDTVNDNLAKLAEKYGAYPGDPAKIPSSTTKADAG